MIVAVIVQGDFALTPNLQFNAGHDLSFTLPGTFTNGAFVQAVNDLSVNAGDIANSGTLMAARSSRIRTRCGTPGH